jgi:hypothetical protein
MSSEKVRASHLLLKHEGSRRPASWKDPEGKVIKQTSRNDAVAKLNAFRADVLSGKAQLADLAAVHSDCNSAKRGGDLGLSRPEYMCSVFRHGFLWFFFSLFSCRLKMERGRIDGFFVRRRLDQKFYDCFRSAMLKVGDAGLESAGSFWMENIIVLPALKTQGLRFRA